VQHSPATPLGTLRKPTRRHENSPPTRRAAKLERNSRRLRRLLEGRLIETQLGVRTIALAVKAGNGSKFGVSPARSASLTVIDRSSAMSRDSSSIALQRSRASTAKARARLLRLSPLRAPARPQPARRAPDAARASPALLPRSSLASRRPLARRLRQRLHALRRHTALGRVAGHGQWKRIQHVVLAQDYIVSAAEAEDQLPVSGPLPTRGFSVIQACNPPARGRRSDPHQGTSRFPRGRRRLRTGARVGALTGRISTTML
jgi:hypothetical protein